MGSEGPARRSFCLRCSKPARICLCGRLKLPPLDNSIAVTILQHSLEKSHPLNSVRVAKLGLKNLAVIPVTDVNFHARFLIRPLKPNRNCSEIPDWNERLDFSSTHLISSNSVTSSSGNGLFQSESLGFSSEIPESKEKFHPSPVCSCVTDDPDQISFPTRLSDDEVTTNFSNYTVSFSFEEILVSIERTAKPNIGWILNHPVGRAVASNGFMVRKLQRKKQLFQGSEEFKDFEEFKLVIPPGSVLLFPNANAIELSEVDFEVKHLIVLDGTWAKARRMYYENPWLKLLPHLKLDMRKESLYSEVRHQPKAGCLSTIESIVCALKGLVDDIEGLNDLLEVFKSMIGDQRRCKDEKFKAMSKT